MISEAAHTVLFYVFAAAAVLLALAVTNTRKLLRSAIYLMFVLLASAGLYLLLGAEFLAGIQVLVYVGGLVVLIVFAIMLTRSADMETDVPARGRRLLAAVAAGAFACVTVWALCSTQFPLAPQAKETPDQALVIGRQLLSTGKDGFVMPFELISLLLLAAAIGGMVVARKVPPPGQPFTTGGDLPGEAEFQPTRKQREMDQGVRND